MTENDVEYSSSALDSSKLLFLHHSDHPGLLLVSKLLNGDNYYSWCRAMRISLSAKNKIGFITGKISEPDEVNDPDKHALWQRCNDMVLSWILQSLEPDFADSVLFCNTPRAIWEDLRERFSLGNAPHIFQIQQDIYRIEQGQMSVAAYYTKLKGLWDELSSYNSNTCTCGGEYHREATCWKKDGYPPGHPKHKPLSCSFSWRCIVCSRRNTLSSLRTGKIHHSSLSIAATN